MRIIDADALDKRIYNDVPISTFGSIRRMAAVRELIEEAPTIDSIYGYKIDDLVMLAATLENDCVVPRDLANYHDNLKTAYQVVLKMLDDETKKYIERLGADQ